MIEHSCKNRNDENHDPSDWENAMNHEYFDNLNDQSRSHSLRQTENDQFWFICVDICIYIPNCICIFVFARVFVRLLLRRQASLFVGQDREPQTRSGHHLWPRTSYLFFFSFNLYCSFFLFPFFLCWVSLFLFSFFIFHL